MSHWPRIEVDFQEHYGIDLGSHILHRRTSRWLRTRIVGLMSMESRLRHDLFPPTPQGR